MDVKGDKKDPPKYTTCFGGTYKGPFSKFLKNKNRIRHLKFFKLEYNILFLIISFLYILSHLGRSDLYDAKILQIITHPTSKQ